MGLFSFIASAGAKVFGGKKLTDIANLPGVMKAHLKSEGLEANHIHFWAEGEALVVSGWVPSKDIKEKVVIASGNVEGVDTVEDRLVVGPPPVFKAPEVKAAAPAPVAVATTAKVMAEAQPADLPPLPTKEEASKHEWESKTHTVVKGDTLSKIAKTVYGDPMKYPAIFEANKPMLKHPDKIYPGQVLRIPKL